MGYMLKNEKTRDCFFGSVSWFFNLENYIMKNLKLLLVVLINIFFYNMSSAQQRLLFALERESKDQIHFVNKNNIDAAVLIYQQYFVTNNELDEIKLRKNIDKLVSRKDFSGYVILNWEGFGYSALVNSQSDNNVRFSKYLKQFIKSIDIVKEMRPNVKISYFDFPQRRVDKRTLKQWYRFADGLLPLFNKLDFFSPCLYSNYLDSKEREGNLSRIDINLSFALEYGKLLNKPVYPFMWHRINPSGSKYRYALIPEKQFAKEISYVLDFKKDDEKVAGIIWWQSEQYDIDRAIRLSKSKLSVRQDIVKDTKSNQLDFFQRYYNKIKVLFK